jgi:hypothetical protein
MNTFKKSELISSEIVSSAKNNPCGQCGGHIKRSESPIAVKFYSKAPVYLHFSCKQTFINTLREY